MTTKLRTLIRPKSAAGGYAPGLLPESVVTQIEGIGRRCSYAYVVDDIVYSEINNKVALKCIAPGTTSDNLELDISGVAIGETIIDGGVTWKIIHREREADVDALISGLSTANTNIQANTAALNEVKADVDALRADITDGAFAPANCYNRRIVRSGNSVSLMWRDPEPTIVDGNVIASWTKTVIVKKEGSYPENVTDGTIVVTSTVKNQYASTAYVDTQANSSNWFYRAFPYSNSAYSLSDLNKFDFFSYAIYIDEDDPVEETCVHKLAGYDNYFLDFMEMNFTTDKFYWGGWKDEPWIPKPCMLTYAGVVDYYLNPDDYTQKADGTASAVTNTGYSGNAMMEWQSIFTKVERVGSKLYMYFASHKLDDGYECYSTKKSDGTYADHFYMPIYEGSLVGSTLRSMSTGAKPKVSTTAEQEATYAAANGTGWTTTVWADENLMQMIGVLCFGRLNFQVACGYNCGSSTSAVTHNCGSGNTKGMFYGQTSTSSYATKFFGMENWWGHRWRRPNGLMMLSGTVYVKMTRSTVDGSTVTDYNRTGSGYINTGIKVPSASESYIKHVAGSKWGTFIPDVVSGGSSTTYYSDACWSATSDTRQLLLGGSVYDGFLAGLFAFNVSDAPSHSLWLLGASISYKAS